MNKKWSLSLGKFFGIKVYMHWTFLILIGWILMMNLRAGHSLIEGSWSILFILALFACVILHEFGHALTARRFKIQTSDITIYPIGGVASLEGIPEKPSEELLVAIAGPLVNVAIAILLFVYLRATGAFPNLQDIKDPGYMQNLPFVFNLFAANLLLAVFNLIPAFPMDGGRVLRALLAFKMGHVKATKIAASVGQLLAIFFVFIGFFYDFWLVFIGLFIFVGAGSEAAAESVQNVLTGKTVRQAMMSRFTVLSPHDTLEKAVALLLDGQDKEFLVAEDGLVKGVLLRNDIIKGLSEFGKTCTLAKVMCTEFVTLSPEVALRDVFQKLMATRCKVFPVVENGRLTGMIDMDNVQELIWVNNAIKA